MSMSPGGQPIPRAKRLCITVLLPAILSLTAAQALAEPKPDFSSDAVEPVVILSKRIAHFAKSDPAKRVFGRLTYLGGLVLSSPSAKFGGWSGLEIDADGRKFVAVSDAGTWLAGQFDYEGATLTGISAATIGPLLGLGGVALPKERDRDAESIVLVDGTLAKGTVLVAYEQNHRIARLPVTDKGLGAPTANLPLPPDARRQPRNKALESVCVMRGGASKGAIVALAERFPSRNETQHTGWMLPVGSAAWSTLAIRNIGGYDLTDCKGLPDGSMLVLERRFRWSSWYEGVKVRLRRFDAQELRSGALMEGDVLLDADMDFEIDNLEGLSVHRSLAGDTVLTMISDNNFSNLLQRTILLQFALAGPVAQPARPIATTKP